MIGCPVTDLHISILFYSQVVANHDCDCDYCIRDRQQEAFCMNKYFDIMSINSHSHAHWQLGRYITITSDLDELYLPVSCVFNHCVVARFVLVYLSQAWI